MRAPSPRWVLETRALDCLPLWRAGLDTAEIARRLGLRESAVANALAWLFDREDSE